MTCYFRHLDSLFKKAGVQVTPENKKQIDKAIHELVKTTYKDCPATWREVKKRIMEDEDTFAAKLNAALTNRQTGAS